MKATDLMIGDFVKLDDKIMKVVEIYGSTRVPLTSSCRLIGEYGTYTTGEVDPVPLTEELLRTNAWSYDEGQGGWIDYRVLNMCGVPHSISSEKGEKFFFDDSIPISFIHELQHCLRLVGQNDLANNFKIR